MTDVHWLLGVRCPVCDTQSSQESAIILIFFSFETGIASWPGTHYKHQVCIQLTETQGLKTCTTTPCIVLILSEAIQAWKGDELA